MKGNKIDLDDDVMSFKNEIKNDLWKISRSQQLAISMMNSA